jgi:hypothetical protein
MNFFTETKFFFFLSFVFFFSNCCSSEDSYRKQVSIGGLKWPRMKPAQNELTALGFAGIGGEAVDSKKSKKKKESSPAKEMRRRQRSASNPMDMKINATLSTIGIDFASPASGAAPRSLARRSTVSEKKESESYYLKEEMMGEAFDDEDSSDREVKEEEEEEGIDPIALRSNFNPLANFTPSVAVDQEGKAKIPVSIPDNLTRYRFITICFQLFFSLPFFIIFLAECMLWLALETSTFMDWASR